MRLFFIFFLFIINIYADLTTIKVQLNWESQFEFAGFYMARELGYYKEAGLNVEITSYNENSYRPDIVKKVLNNEEFSEKGGGGLGMIDVAKKAGSDLRYSFFEFDEKYSFFEFKVTI